jgi:hypothetical protein
MTRSVTAMISQSAHRHIADENGSVGELFELMESPTDATYLSPTLESLD